LAGADLSVAMQSGVDVTRARADALLVVDRLPALAEGLRVARRARTVMRQNLAWAAGYNLLVLPLAALGLLAPWMAAIGMSASSLVVVGNALRARRPGVDGSR
ncbi:MAG: cation-translocating P-type ATPase, partial [Planctomycetes bacterium]|nr:cation-translocating P-type ATPase [Planctomycetota bacterium]